MVRFAALARAATKARDDVLSRPGSADIPIAVAAAIAACTQQEDVEIELVRAIELRATLLEKAKTDLEYRKEQIALCRKSVAHFIGEWGWTYDPRRTPSTIPFALFDAQTDFLEWLTDRLRGKECGVVEKSRDAGLSWLCVAFAAHQFLFVPGSKATFGSRKEILVDRLGDPDSLFSKLRQFMEALPPWLLPKNWSSGFLKFVNRDNGATITGEAGDNMGRGGRSRLYFLDEFAFVPRAQVVDAAVSNNSDVRIYVSTPNGTGNTFSKKRFSGHLPVFRIHWKQDPRKNYWELKSPLGEVIQSGNGAVAPKGAVYPWYEKMKQTLDPVVLAQEVDIDYAASVEGVAIPNAWVMAAVGLKLIPAGDRLAGLDIADEGANKNVLIIRHGSVVKFIEAWAYGNTTQTAYKVRDHCIEEKVHRLFYDAIGVGAGVGGTLYSADDLPFGLSPVRGGDKTSGEFYPKFNRKSEDVFKNIRAEIWWNLRLRFERTYEYVNRLADYPHSELISIPNCAELIGQLSQPLRKYTDTGLIKIESKEDMKSRSVESPDYADALAYAFAIPTAGETAADWMQNA